MTQDIGTRMKSYEQNRRLANGAVIIRVDGKAFHTWTKKISAGRPFDEAIMTSMQMATLKTSRQMQGFKLAYTQSDESTFLLTNIDNQQQWFGGKLDKVISVSASMFTYYFNEEFAYWVNTRGYPQEPAFFDARAFNIPIDDAANCFYWRQLDWMRNSVTMLARNHFSHKDLQGKSTQQMKSMLESIDVFWEMLFPWEKYGTFISPEGKLPFSMQMNYTKINEMAGLN